MNHVRHLQVSADHPSLPGHFPGNPVVPGVLMLDLVAETLEQWRPGATLAAVRQAKFFAPVRPGEEIRVELEAAKTDEVKFRCTVAERAVAAGTLTLTP